MTMYVTINRTKTGLTLKSANMGFKDFVKAYTGNDGDSLKIPAGGLTRTMYDIADYANNTLNEAVLFEVE